GSSWRSEEGAGIAEASARKDVVRLSSTIDYVIESDIMTRNVVKMPRTIGKAAAVRPPSFQPQANFLVLLNCSKTAARSTRCIFAIKVGGKKGCTAGSKPPIADKRRQAVGTGSRIPEVYGLAMGNVGFLRRAVHVKKQIDVNGKNRVPLKTGSSKHSVPVAGVQAALGHSPASTTLGRIHICGRIQMRWRVLLFPVRLRDWISMGI